MYDCVFIPGCCPAVTGVVDTPPPGGAELGVVPPPNQSENGSPPWTLLVLPLVLRRPVIGSYWILEIGSNSL
jgi:hypothetical protein